MHKCVIEKTQSFTMIYNKFMAFMVHLCKTYQDPFKCYTYLCVVYERDKIYLRIQLYNVMCDNIKPSDAF